MFIASLILSFFLFFGYSVLDSMSASISAVQIAGGAILFMMAIKMIFPSKPTDDSNNSTDPLIVPLATPIMAGPSSIAMTMIIAGHQDIEIWLSWLAIMCACLFTLLILLCAPSLKRILKDKGMAAIERLMSMILTVIGTQMILAGALSVA